MRTAFRARVLSCLLAAAMTFNVAAVSVSADDSKGKYVQDVFIAYGEKKEDAEKWLKDNGWEPVCDLNDGKTSKATGFHNAVAVMGIKRTDDEAEAVTDMATMFMKGGYSFDDYEALVKEKKADIDEFINSFVPALNEYRDNYNGKGSEGGKKRAQMAHDILNKFYDGDPNGDYAVNDTGKPLGDLLLNKTKTEIGDDVYKTLPDAERQNTADLQQIILESSGPAVLSIEQTLALATDTAEDTWLDRVDGLTGDDLVDRIAEFAPDVKGQRLAPSAAMSLLAAHFEDYSRILAEEWLGVHQDILWYEEYCEAHELLQGDDDEESYKARLDEYFQQLNEEDPDLYEEEFDRFSEVALYYYALQDIDYSGEWGETLFEFYRPEDEDADYTEEFDYFAPIAAALSDGQRAALEFLSTSTLFKMGMDSDSVMEADFSSVSEMFKDKDGNEIKSISIYSGINRAIFRKGVALTSKAMSQKAMGRDPYDKMWDFGGIADIVAYTTFAVGTVSMIAGVCMAVHSAKTAATAASAAASASIQALDNIYKEAYKAFIEAGDKLTLAQDAADAAEIALEAGKETAEAAQKAADAAKQAHAAWVEATNKASAAADKLKEAQAAKNAAGTTAGKLSTAGKWLMGIGGALMIMAAVLKGVQLYEYYHRTFSPIPTMIVDEADIVSYTTDRKGNKVKVLTFDQFAYYEVVKCNRQQIGLHTSAQVGVSDYAEWGCGDAADINADVGTQWLALYINRSKAKGDPILADSLTLKTGKDSEKTPKGYSGYLHMFNEENPVKIDNRDYCYRSDNDGMYLYWKTEKDSSLTASTFSGGTIAISAIGGLIAGIAGTTLFMLPKKKRKEAAA